MLLLPCPFCGERNESEFLFGGAKRVRREIAAAAAGDSEWVEYLTVTANSKGPVREKWWHRLDCGTWVVVERDTVTHHVAPARPGAGDAK